MSIDKLIEKEPSLEFAIPVLKWLKDPESVSREERKATYNTANAANAAYVDYATYVAYADYAAADAADAAYVDNAANAEKRINRYFTKISITRAGVEAELFKGEEVKYNKEFFKNTKIKIESEEHNKYIQELAFKADCYWFSVGESIRWIDATFLYFDINGQIRCAGVAKSDTNKYKEIFIPMTAKKAEPVNDIVQNPRHYDLFEDTQVIEIIASSMSTEAFHGYCLGNVLKYRLRAGNKDDTAQEIGKADKYKELYEDFKHLCK